MRREVAKGPRRSMERGSRVASVLLADSSAMRTYRIVAPDGMELARTVSGRTALVACVIAPAGFGVGVAERGIAHTVLARGGMMPPFRAVPGEMTDAVTVVAIGHPGDVPVAMRGVRRGHRQGQRKRRGTKEFDHPFLPCFCCLSGHWNA